VAFFKQNKDQDQFYNELIENRRHSHLLSCGYEERFDPFLLDRKPYLARVYEELFAELLPTKVGTILDVGCGTGLYWPILARYGDEIAGIDSSVAMAREANRLIEVKKLCNIRGLVQNSGRMGFADSQFDVVLCVDSLHHIPDLTAAIREFHRVLKPGGRFVAIEPNMFNPLMLLAHLIPAEERYGAVRSYAPLLRHLFHPYFRDIQVEYVNYVASAESAAQLERVQKLGRLLVSLPLLRRLSLRQTLTMSRRDRVD